MIRKTLLALAGVAAVASPTMLIAPIAVSMGDTHISAMKDVNEAIHRNLKNGESERLIDDPQLKRGMKKFCANEIVGTVIAGGKPVGCPGL